MGTAEKKYTYTLEEFLEIDETSDFKNEFFDGEIFAMAGGTHRHSQLCSNLGRAIGNAVEEKDCVVFDSSLKVMVEEANSIVMPDVSAVCGPIDLFNDKEDLIENPVVVFEVLSPGTAGWDRGGKFHIYRKIASLKEYVLIEQEIAHIDVFLRKEDKVWEINSYVGLEATLLLQSLEVEIPLSAIYRKVKLDEPKE